MRYRENMKNLLREIRKCAQTKYRSKYDVGSADCDANGRLHVWVLLNLVEEMQREPSECLAKIAPQYSKDLKQVSLQLFSSAHAGDTLELEARFYEIDKRRVELKVFVRKIKPDKSTKRICRAGYQFHAVYNKQVA